MGWKNVERCGWRSNIRINPVSFWCGYRRLFSGFQLKTPIPRCGSWPACFEAILWLIVSAILQPTSQFKLDYITFIFYVVRRDRPPSRFRRCGRCDIGSSVFFSSDRISWHQGFPRAESPDTRLFPSVLRQDRLRNSECNDHRSCD